MAQLVWQSPSPQKADKPLAGWKPPPAGMDQSQWAARPANADQSQWVAPTSMDRPQTGIPGGSATQPPPAKAAAPGTTGVPFLDSTYYANVAAHQAGVNDQINALNQSGAYAQTDLQNALAQLSHQQPLDQLKSEQAANNRGALFSTVLGGQLGELARAYADKQSGLQDSYSRSAAARASQVASLQAGGPLYDAQQAADAAIRAANAAAQDKTLGEPGNPATGAGSGSGTGSGGGSAAPKTGWNASGAGKGDKVTSFPAQKPPAGDKKTSVQKLASAWVSKATTDKKKKG